MGIIRHSEREKKEPYPGVIRQAIVDRDSGGGALHTTYITIAFEGSTANRLTVLVGRPPTVFHPQKQSGFR